MNSQPDMVSHPPHYAGYPATVECIDITRHMNFQLGNAFKYVWRAGKKGGKEKEIEDLKKALWYLGDRRLYFPGTIRSELAVMLFRLIEPNIKENWRRTVLWHIVNDTNATARLEAYIEELESK